MRTLIWVGGLACLLGAAALSAAEPLPAAHTYTVDDMLQLEALGTARFTTDGRTLVFERFGRFDQQTDFGKPYVIGQTQSRLYRVDLDTESDAAHTNLQALRPLLEQSEDSGYTLQGLSPDGGTAVYQQVSTEAVALGAVPLKGGPVKHFDFTPPGVLAMDLSWASNQVLPYAALPPSGLPPTARIGSAQQKAVASRWSEQREGRVATAEAIGSGRYKKPSPPMGRLVLANIADGSARTLAQGEFSSYFASGDGVLLAALEEIPLAVDATKRIEHGANIGGIEHHLRVFDAAGGTSAPRDACASCDVLEASVAWSATAPLLAFYARDAGNDWSQARWRIYDSRNDMTTAIDLGGLEPHVGRLGYQLDVQSAWLGDDLAVLAAPKQIEKDKKSARADWYLLGGATPVNLTAAFSGDVPTLIALAPGRLVMLHEDAVWSVSTNGERRKLTDGIDGKVAAWTPPSAYGALPNYNLQPSGTLLLQVMPNATHATRRLLFLDTVSGRIDTVAAATAEGQFIAVAPTGRRVAIAEKIDNETVLSIADAKGIRRELLRLNTHLRGVVGGTPIRIDHKGPKGDARMSWLLLPPGYQPGTRLPTIVNVYPGSKGREKFAKWKLDQMHALNDHLLAAAGYAVLYPSLPVTSEPPRDPLSGLADEVFVAVDAVVAQGYVDPDRLAVQGQSYGGYATAALIGLTDRFKTAVAQAGLYDLVSAYGAFDVRRRPHLQQSGLDLFQASLLETGQAGLGAPPWQDIDRYLRNSPLMRVADINTPILIFTADLDYIQTTQSEEFFTALTRLNKDAVMVRYYGEDHVYNSPANIRDMWRRILEWYGKTLRPHVPE